MKAKIGTFIHDETGQTMIEYVMLGLLVSVIAMSVLRG